MEDAVDALKLATWVFIFILALSIVFKMFSQAREVSEIVLNYSDNTYFASYTEADGDDVDGRTVGIETVIPTLYRYYKEKFSVDIIINKNKSKLYESPNEKFDEEIERKVYNRTDTDGIYKKYKDLYIDGVSWLARPNVDIKNRVSAYIANGKNVEGNLDNIVNGVELKDYKDYGLKEYRDKTFVETFYKVDNTPDDGIIEADDGSIIELKKGTTKMYITYTLK